MRRWKNWAERGLARGAGGEEGSAALEFVTVGTLLLVPLVYLVVALGTIQSHALGVESGARALARVLATGGGGAHAEAVLSSIITEYGMDADTVEVAYHCTPAGTECPAPGAILTVRVASRAVLPLLPALPGWERATSVPVQGAAVQRISRTWSAP